jgi:hypothetical protein
VSASSNRWIAAALGVSTLLVYGWGLEFVPAFLKYEEVFFALESHAIATTLHDTNGRLLPTYFQVYANAWYQPVLIYWGALFQLVFPLSDTMLRMPTAVVAAINVALTYLIGARLFKHTGWAVLGALFLAITPPHFILGRVAMDYLYPVPFVLGWLLGIIIFLETRSVRALAVGSLLLGVGFFSYIAAVGLMPVFYAVTILILVASGERSWRPYAAASVGFAAFVGFGLLIAVQTPEYVDASLARYGPGTSSSDPLQQVRELFNYTNVSARAGLFSEFFNAGYLFFSGGSNPVDSTRTAGVFLLPMAAFLAAGVYSALRERTVLTGLLLFGFVFSVVPAATVMERYTIDRHLVMLPFGALLGALGARWLWSRRLTVRVSQVLLPLCVTGVGVALSYGAYTLVTRGQLTKSTLPLAVASVLVYALGRLSDRVQRGSVLTASLILLSFAQFAYVVSDYFDDYRLRSAPAFGSNLRGGVEALLRHSRPDESTPLAVSAEIPFGDYYVRWYSAQHGRADVPKRVRYIATDGSVTPGEEALFLTGNSVNDRTFAAALDLETIAVARDPDDGPVFFVSRRRSAGR